MWTHVSARTWMRLVTALIVAGHINEASAQLNLFHTEMQAQRHCPNDTVVWLDFNNRIYYVRSQRLFAKGTTGTFVCRKEARSERCRRSVLGRR